MHDEEIHHTHILFSNEAWFHLSGYVNSQNNGHMHVENLMIIHKVSQHDIINAAWCTISGNSLSENVNSHHYVTKF